MIRARCDFARGGGPDTVHRDAKVADFELIFVGHGPR